MRLLIEADTEEGMVEVVYSDLQVICDGMEGNTISEYEHAMSIEELNSDPVFVNMTTKVIYKGENTIDIYNEYGSKISNARIISGSIPPNFDNRIYIEYFYFVSESKIHILANTL